MAEKKIKIGIVGCGNISGIYLQNCPKMDSLELVAVADLVKERAEKAAKDHNVPKVMTTDELIADPEIEIVLNLTVPKVHAEVALAAIDAGKSVYNEKPIAITREDGQKIVSRAEEKGVLVGCSPDTFLGGGIQTCRKLIDDGAIGEPIGSTAFMTCHGHESWHPDPEFYYEVGGGPMLDMGPYYITAMINLMGPVRRVTGSARASFPERTITSEPKKGKTIKVETPTYIAGVLDFHNNAIGMIITSFDTWASQLPSIEIYGTKGSISVPNPNDFDGPVKLFTSGDEEWKDVPLTHGYVENCRGVGVADMACALISGRAHRANGKLAYHVLDVMYAINDASEAGKHIELESTCDTPAALPTGLKSGELD